MHKLYQKKGMTLMETLAAVLMVTLLSTVILSGSQAAFRVYVQDTFTSESQLVSDTINKALSDVLHYAVNVKTDTNGKVISYTNRNYGVTGGNIQVGQDSGVDEGRIYLDFHGVGSKDNLFLLSDLSYSGLQVVPPDYDMSGSSNMEIFDLHYSEGVFTGRYRLCNKKKHLLSDVFSFTFRAVNG